MKQSIRMLFGQRFIWSGERSGGRVEGWLKLEQVVVEDVRTKNYEKVVLEQRMRELAKQETLERKEYFDRVREELLHRQLERTGRKGSENKRGNNWRTDGLGAFEVTSMESA